MTQYWRPATLEDVDWVAPRLRKADVEEIKASCGTSAYEGLYASFAASNPALALVDGDGPPLGIFGLVPDADGNACVWMLGTGEIEKYPMTFLRNSLEWVRQSNRQYPILYNQVDARNGVHIKWLRWMGFTLFREVIYGPENRLFYEFFRIEPCVQ
jgi:hypothetical protein